MVMVNIHEAKTHLSRLLAAVERGEEVMSARAGQPIARLSAIHETAGERALGRDAGAFEVPDDFDAPLPEALLEAFGAA